MQARHEKLEAWQLAYQLTLDVYRLSGQFPKHEQYGLTSQVRRAAASVPANIVEGVARRGYRELGRFLNYSIGSLAETRFFLKLARDLEYMNADAYAEIEATACRASKVLWGFYRSIPTQ